jgi:hypothetical protein
MEPVTPSVTIGNGFDAISIREHFVGTSDGVPVDQCGFKGKLPAANVNDRESWLQADDPADHGLAGIERWIQSFHRRRST